MTHPYAERCKLHTNNLLAERVQKIYADMRKPLNNSDDLLVAIHTEIRYADSTSANGSSMRNYLAWNTRFGKLLIRVSS
mgnify:CR=1 FL=1